MLIFDFFEVLYDFLVGFFELSKSGIFDLGFSLHFKLMIYGDLFHERQVQIVNHSCELVIKRTLTDNVHDKAFNIMKLFFKVVLFFLVKRVGASILNVQ